MAINLYLFPHTYTHANTCMHTTIATNIYTLDSFVYFCFLFRPLTRHKQLQQQQWHTEQPANGLSCGQQLPVAAIYCCVFIIIIIVVVVVVANCVIFQHRKLPLSAAVPN